MCVHYRKLKLEGSSRLDLTAWKTNLADRWDRYVCVCLHMRVLYVFMLASVCTEQCTLYSQCMRAEDCVCLCVLCVCVCLTHSV